MSRVGAVVKREFLETARTRSFVIGTLLGPLFIAAVMFLPVLIAGDGPKSRTIAVVDETGAGLGARVAGMLAPPGVEAMEDRTQYTIEVVRPDGARSGAALDGHLAGRIEAEEIDGYLWIPADVVAGGTVRYKGKSATSPGMMSELRGSVQQVVQHERLSASGIEAAQVAAAMQPVPFESRRPGKDGEDANADAIMFLAMVMGYAIFLMVMMYGMAVMRGAMEEKRDRIVEVVISSIRSRDLLLGKVLGIGGAGIVQVATWVLFGVVALVYGDALAARFGVELPELPRVPLSVGLAFIAFFAGGFFVYSALYAVIGSIATTDQEAQQMNFPVMMPLMIGFFMAFNLMNSPDGTVALVGSLVPLTSPIVMPMRMALADVPAAQVVLSIALLAATGTGVLWGAAKIYRIGMLASGKRPSMGELMRWLRTA